MNEKLFLYFSRKIGSVTIDGHEYAFCHPLKLEIDEKGGHVVTCTTVDREGNFYDFCWFPWADFCSDDWGNPFVKKIGRYEELPVKDVGELISYLEGRKL